MTMALLASFAGIAFRVLLPPLLWLAVGRFWGLSTESILLGVIAVALIGLSWSWRSTYICRHVYVLRREFWNYKVVEARTYILCDRGTLFRRYHEVFESFLAAKACYDLHESYRPVTRHENVNSVYMVEAFKVRGLASVGANETIGPLLITTPYKVLQEFQDGAKEGVYLKREEAWMTAELEKIRGLENTDGYDELASAIYADSHAKTQARYDPKWGS